MKIQLKSLLLVSFLFSQTGLANNPGDPFDITQDGIQYHCVAGTINPGGVLDCVEKAYAGPFSRDEATQLCSGAMSIAPADCALKAYSGAYDKAQSISLCTQATSTGPVDCANLAYQGPFSREESLQLCSRRGTVENAQCAVRAYAGPYTKAQAITMCQANPNLVNLALSALHNEAKVGFGAVMQKSLMKARLMNELGDSK